MSRTDAHRPAWVQQYDPDVPATIDHDHRRGECRVETLEYNRWYQTRPRHHRWSGCAKYERVEDACPHVGIVTWRNAADVAGKSACYRVRQAYNYWRLFNDPTPPTWRTRLVIPEHEHADFVRHDDWPCSCDDFPEDPTCTYGFDRRYRVYVSRYYGHHVPSWLTHATWHAPERGRERTSLRDAARRWNAGDDLDDFDFPNYQHRHDASWYWD